MGAPNPGSSHSEIRKWPLKARERPQEEAGHSRRVGGGFKRRGTLPKSLGRGGRKMSRLALAGQPLQGFSRDPSGVRSRVRSTWYQHHDTLSSLHPQKGLDGGGVSSLPLAGRPARLRNDLEQQATARG